MRNIGRHAGARGLEVPGLPDIAEAYWNLDAPALYEAALGRGEGRLAQGGALVVRTGAHTGRAPNDKFIVREPASEAEIWWGAINKPIEADQFESLHRKMRAALTGRDVFVQDCWVGAAPEFRLPIRVITECAWHNLFARNMFIRPTAAELNDFVPAFTVLHVPSCGADPAVDGTNSDVFILLDFAQGLILIGGTIYAGEIKKSVFSMLNYLLPARGVMPMHSSVNVGPDGRSAIFFGLSGTGKTTLSADSSRVLVGDDEHGWSNDGVFNFEGGCYAKVIKLSPEAEPEIHATTGRFGTVLENVVMDEATGRLDLDDATLTENTRASYPIDFIPNASATGMAGHPANIVMLTADAFGVLPPIAKLTPAQASYHFLSGYTAKVAGTEKGLGKEPQATFSTCFGAPFMPRHPSVYARLLGERIVRHDVACWLVNTGWSGGGYGVGQRMPIGHTRALLAAALDGGLGEIATEPDPNFGFAVPVACPGVPAEGLNPRATWADQAAYDAKAAELVGRFQDNFVQYADHVGDDVRNAAPAAA